MAWVSKELTSDAWCSGCYCYIIALFSYYYYIIAILLRYYCYMITISFLYDYYSIKELVGWVSAFMVLGSAFAERYFSCYMEADRPTAKNVGFAGGAATKAQTPCRHYYYYYHYYYCIITTITTIIIAILIIIILIIYASIRGRARIIKSPRSAGCRCG